MSFLNRICDAISNPKSPLFAERFAVALRCRTLAISFVTASGLLIAKAHAGELNDQPLTGNAFFAAKSAMSQMDDGEYDGAAADAQRSRRLAPNSEFAARLLVDALAKAGQRAKAIEEAEAALSQGGASGQLLAQLGYLMQAAGNTQDAIHRFSGALSAGGLTNDQEKNIKFALREARFTSVANRAYAAVAKGEHSLSLNLARKALLLRPDHEDMMSLEIDALTQTGRSEEALAKANAAIEKGYRASQILAQRGYLRLQQGNYDGAASDFQVAQSSHTITSSQAARLRYAMADARSLSAEANGNTDAAIQTWHDYLASAPSDPEGWFSLGFLLIRSGKNDEGALALEKGVGLSRRGNILLQLGTEYLGRSAPKASAYLREVIDARQASDPTIQDLTDQDLERIRNQITQSEASVRSTVVGSFGQKDSKSFAGVETVLRFDGRHLPSVSGLEAYIRGSWSRDQNNFTESDLAIGLRWRPFEGTNFVVASEWMHRFDPRELDQLAINWGYSLGGISFPYEEGWEFFSTAGAYGSWRLSEERYLQNLAGSVGFAYNQRAPFSYVIAPSFAFDASYDSADSNHRFAFGVGPAVDFTTWLGGDMYRGYDFRGSLQIKYLVPIGASARQSGWRLSFDMEF